MPPGVQPNLLQTDAPNQAERADREKVESRTVTVQQRLNQAQGQPLTGAAIRTITTTCKAARDILTLLDQKAAERISKYNEQEIIVAQRAFFVTWRMAQEDILEEAEIILEGVVVNPELAEREAAKAAAFTVAKAKADSIHEVLTDLMQTITNRKDQQDVQLSKQEFLGLKEDIGKLTKSLDDDLSKLFQQALQLDPGNSVTITTREREDVKKIKKLLTR